MISPEDRETIVRLAQRHGVRRILLFGSSATESPAEAGDIDLAVEGVEPSRFFAFYGDLMFGLSKPVDLVDLGKQSRFTELVRREGIPVYG